MKQHEIPLSVVFPPPSLSHRFLSLLVIDLTRRSYSFNLTKMLSMIIFVGRSSGQYRDKVFASPRATPTYPSLCVNNFWVLRVTVFQYLSAFPQAREHELRRAVKMTFVAASLLAVLTRVRISIAEYWRATFFFFLLFFFRSLPPPPSHEPTSLYLSLDYEMQMRAPTNLIAPSTVYIM